MKVSSDGLRKRELEERETAQKRRIKNNKERIFKRSVKKYRSFYVRDIVK